MPVPYSSSGTAASYSSVGFYKVLRIDAGLPQNRPEGALRHVPGWWGTVVYLRVSWLNQKWVSPSLTYLALSAGAAPMIV